MELANKVERQEDGCLLGRCAVQSTRTTRHNPEDSHLHTRCREDLNSYQVERPFFFVFFFFFLLTDFLVRALKSSDFMHMFQPSQGPPRSWHSFGLCSVIFFGILSCHSTKMAYPALSVFVHFVLFLLCFRFFPGIIFLNVV
jgi:hypothetical protein